MVVLQFASPTVSNGLTPHQQQQFEKTVKHLKLHRKCLLTGGAGTGKTRTSVELINHHLRSTPGAKVAVTAPTNKAVRVARKMGFQAIQNSLVVTYRTTHQLLNLRMGYNEDEKVLRRASSLNLFEENWTLILVDEGSMANRELCRYLELKQRELPNCWFLYVADPAQLNPVGEPHSPCLDIPFKAELSEIVRQEGGNLIKIITHCRKRALEPEQYGAYELPDLQGKTKLVQRIGRGDLIEKAIAHHRKYAPTKIGEDPEKEFRILAWSNDRVDWYNSRIRAELYGVDAEPFLPGERVITRDNVKVLKGSIPASTELTIVSAMRRYDRETKLHTWRLQVLEDQGDALMQHEIECLDERSEQDYSYLLARLNQIAKQTRRWADYHELRDRFAKVRPLYAQTVHTSQGSTFDEVGIDARDLGLRLKINKASMEQEDPEEAIAEYNRLWYTAMSRPRYRIWVV